MIRNPEIGRCITHPTSVCTWCVWSSTNRFSVSLVIAQGNWILGEDCASKKNWGSLSEPLKSRTWCPYPDFSPLPFYTTEHESTASIWCFTSKPQQVYITRSPYKLTAREHHPWPCFCSYLASYLLQSSYKAFWKTMVFKMILAL